MSARLDIPTRRPAAATVGTLLLAALPVLFTATATAVALDPIATSFGVSVATVHWVSSSYLLAATAAVPSLGWLVGRVGTRRTWLAATAVFGAGSLAGALAPSITVLLVARVVQGLGGGLILPLLQTILVQVVGPARFARAMAMTAIPGQLVPVLGPATAGALVDGLGWPATFWLPALAALPALGLAAATLPEDGERRAQTFDGPGLALVAGGLLALLHGLTEVGDPETGPWTGVPWVAAGVGLVAAYVARWRREGQGIVDLGLLRSEQVRSASAVMLVLGASLWGSLLLLPLYLQQVRDLAVTSTGGLLSLQGVGTLLALVLVEPLMRALGPRTLVRAGFALGALATVPFALAAVAPPEPWVVGTALVARGLGLGVVGVPALAAAYRERRGPDVAGATTLTSISQRLGAAVGVAAFGTLVGHLLRQGADGPSAYGGAFAVAVGLTALGARLARALPARAPQDGHDPTPPADQEVRSMSEPPQRPTPAPSSSCSGVAGGVASCAGPGGSSPMRPERAGWPEVPSAVVFDQVGPPEVLRLAPLEVPVPEPGTVVVRVFAAGVNPVDAMVRRGALDDGRPPDHPRTLGNEMAGVVERVGPSVDGLRPGDEVLGFATMTCHATHVLVPADQVTAKPPGLPWRVAGGLSSAGQMAHHAVEELGVGPGDTVLVHAAAGGVGTIAVQLARMRGATVIGTASPRNHDHLRALGVIPVAYGEGLRGRLQVQAPGGVDAVIDAAGRGALDASMPIVRDPQRVATTIDDDAATRLGVRRLRPVRRAEVLAELAEHAADGRLRLPIHLAVPLGRAARAHEEVEAGHVRGKVVLLADPTA